MIIVYYIIYELNMNYNIINKAYKLENPNPTSGPTSSP